MDNNENSHVGLERLQRLEDSILFQKLKSQNTEFAGLVSKSWGEAEKLLRHIPSVHRTFTSHGPDHALAVLGILEMMLNDLNLNPELNEQEIYILILATLLHDIGMLGRVDANRELSARYRMEHHIRTHDFIVKNWQKLNIYRKYRKMIANVAAAHRRVNIEQFVIERIIGASQLPPPRAKLCAALLRLADECHVTDDRVPEDYGSLDLPNDALQNFASHQQNTGISFNKHDGTITFSIDIETDEIDRMFKAFKEKIQKELDQLQNVYKKNGIPYRLIILDEDREELIRRKLILELLDKGEMNGEELIKNVKNAGEREDEIKRYLDVYGHGEPFAISNHGSYYLSCSQSVFDTLADMFLFNPHKEKEPLKFIESKLCQITLNDMFLGKLLKKSLSFADPRKIVFRIIRTSPSALKYILEHRNELPKKSSGGSSGLLELLKAELQSDLFRYPSLLLEPALIDEAFDETGEHERWSRLKVYQIAEYHKAFDIKKLLEQWCISKGVDAKESFDVDGDIYSIQTKFQFRNDSTDNPIHLMIAAYRMRLPLRLEETEDVKIEGMISKKGEEGDLKRINMVEMKFQKPPTNIKFPMAGSIKKNESGKFVLELHGWNSNGDYPFVVWLWPEEKPKKSGNMVTVKFGMRIGVNYDLLDCKQASDLIEVSNGKKKVTIKIEENLSTEDVDISDAVKGFFNSLEDGMKEVFKKMGVVQQFLGKRIAMPLFLQKELETLILDNKVESYNDAQLLWAQLKEKIGSTKRYYSTISIENREGEEVRIKRYYSSLEGPRQPKFHAQKIESELEIPEILRPENFSDNKKYVECLLGYSRLSPEKIIEHLKCNNGGFPGENLSSLKKLEKLMTEYPEEQRTEVMFNWLPEEDHFWYMVTPFRVVLKEMTWERWVIEAEYFEKIKKDYKRGYIAQREVYKLRGDDPGIATSFGWWAYLCNRLTEAITVTEKAIKMAKGCTEFLAVVNLGLYYLSLAASADDKEKNNLHKTAEYYGRGEELLKTLDKSERTVGLRAVIDDIIQNKKRLHPMGDKYLENFQKIEEETLS